MNIAFFCNHGKTRFFAAVARGLERRRHRVFWISPGRRLAKFLVSQGVPTSQICDITEYADRWVRDDASEPLIPRLIPGGMQLNAMIRADRFLREHSYSLSLRYLVHSAQIVLDHAQAWELDVVLGEQTYALELATASVLQSIPIPYYVPATVRMPSERFALFPSPDQSRFATDLAASTGDLEMAARVLDDLHRRDVKPYYFHSNQGRLHPELSWLWAPAKQLALRVTDPYEMNRPTLGWLMRDRPRRVLNGIRASRYAFSSPRDLTEPYVLFPFIGSLRHRLMSSVSVGQIRARSSPRSQAICLGVGSLPSRSIATGSVTAVLPSIVDFFKFPPCD